MEEILIKVHESYRLVVAVCDKDVFGRKLSDANASVEDGRRKTEDGFGRVLDVSGDFFKGEAFSLESARDEIVRLAREDATFNFVGKDSVDLAVDIGIVKSEGVMEIDGVLVALVLM